MIDETHEPGRACWVESAQGHPDFPIQNLPFGVFSPPSGTPRIGVAIGDSIVDLPAIASLLPDAPLERGTLNYLFAEGAALPNTIRGALCGLLSQDRFQGALAPHLYPAAECVLHLPFAIGDYTDFFAGIHHAENIGRQFRPENPLLPNYKYVPIGYHGRASSIRPSGVPVRRPTGQRKRPDGDVPMVAPSNRLDFELELGIWIGRGNDLGVPIPIGAAAGHIAGYCLLNDWSARDLQAWEYQPLGPFLAKSFHSTISPWVITTAALAPFRRAQPLRGGEDPQPLAYLWDDKDQAQGALALALAVTLSTTAMRAAGLPPHELSAGAAAALYWTPAQLVTHHSSNGCDLRTGDLLGTGTISAADRAGLGSLIEITAGGRDPVLLPGGETRTFLEDGDEIALHARASSPDFAGIGFGPCVARIVG